jgi:glycosyl hydrolase group 75 (putative chitosanase)
MKALLLVSFTLLAASTPDAPAPEPITPAQAQFSPAALKTSSKVPISPGCPAEPTQINLQGRRVPARIVSGAVLFSAGMQIDADGAPNAYGPRNRGLDNTGNAKDGGRWVGVVTDASGKPVVQRSGPFRGLYVSQTTLAQGARVTDPRTYVDASRIPYIALPRSFIEQFAVRLGDIAMVANTRNQKRSYAIFADIGPKGKIGEGSMALARALGISANPRRGGVSNGILYVVFPQSGLGPGKLRTRGEITNSGQKLFKQWGGKQQLAACSEYNRKSGRDK